MWINSHECAFPPVMSQYAMNIVWSSQCDFFGWSPKHPSAAFCPFYPLIYFYENFKLWAMFLTVGISDDIPKGTPNLGIICTLVPSPMWLLWQEKVSGCPEKGSTRTRRDFYPPCLGNSVKSTCQRSPSTFPDFHFFCLPALFCLPC